MADSDVTEVPTSSMNPDTEWSTREKLAIASYVLRSGEQHWPGVGRILKPLGEPGRPADWFSPKFCAQQYTALLEQLDAPKRKRGSERSDTSENIQPGASPEEIIVSRLTKERIEELKKQLRFERTEYRKLKREIELIESGALDDQLDDLLAGIQNERSGEQEKQEKVESEMVDEKESETTKQKSLPRIEEVKVENPNSEKDLPLSSVSANKIGGNATPEENQPLEVSKVENSVESMEITSDISNLEHNNIKLVEASESAGQPVKKSPVAEEPSEAEVSTQKESMTEEIENKIVEETKEKVDDLNTIEGKIDTVEKTNSEKDDPEKMKLNEETDQDASSSIEATVADKNVVTSVSTKRSEYQAESKELTNEDAFGFEAPGEDADSTYNLSIDYGMDQSISLPGTPAPAGSSVFDSFPSSPALSHSSDMDPDATASWKAWRKSIMILWKQVASHRYASLFLQPVTDDIAPNYSVTVYRSMDLATIKKNIESGAIRTTSEFRRDVMLMFQNAIMYNSCEHDVYKMTMEMQKDVIDQIAQFLATQMMVETAQPPVNKSLRRSTMRRSALSEKVGETRSRRSITAAETDAKSTR